MVSPEPAAPSKRPVPSSTAALSVNDSRVMRWRTRAISRVGMRKNGTAASTTSVSFQSSVTMMATVEMNVLKFVVSVLTVSVPKPEQIKPKAIKVQVQE